MYSSTRGYVDNEHLLVQQTEAALRFISEKDALDYIEKHFSEEKSTETHDVTFKVIPVIF
jgi:hypothetical protein